MLFFSVAVSGCPTGAHKSGNTPRNWGFMVGGHDSHTTHKAWVYRILSKAELAQFFAEGGRRRPREFVRCHRSGTHP